MVMVVVFLPMVVVMVVAVAVLMLMPMLVFVVMVVMFFPVVEMVLACGLRGGGLRLLLAVHRHRAFRHVIKTGNQIYKR